MDLLTAAPFPGSVMALKEACRLGAAVLSMGRFHDFLKTLGFSRSRPSAPNVEKLRTDFKARYHNFKLLLNANNKALEIMAAMEQALQGKRSFGMSFVRTSCTSISVNVYRMIKNLTGLAPGKYEELNDRYNDIQEKIEQLLVEKTPTQDRRLVIPLEVINRDMADLAGNKMANLGEIKNNVGLVAPSGFIITAYAYQRFLEENNLQIEIDRRFQSIDVNDIEKLNELSAQVQHLIVGAEIPKDLKAAILASYARLEQEAGQGIRVAMRSSALAEDLTGISFAGQYHSELNVSRENILKAYKEVVASKYSLSAITYRLNRGFKGEEIAMCVGCLAMIDAKIGGVTYSRSPVDLSDDSIFINSAWGLPMPVCDGSIDSDLYVVTRAEPMRVIYEDLKIKKHKFVCLPQEGVCRLDLSGDEDERPSLAHRQARALAEIAVKLEEYYLAPQDIEWAVDQDDSIYVLQSRPLQQVEKIQRDFPTDIIQPENKTVLAKGGTSASPGACSGPVFKVKKEIDLFSFPEGSILVTQQALPRWAPLLSRAVGVVTEQGGFAGHLANVAREYGVPALFGVGGIMDKLNNNDMITLDATGWAVYQGRIASLETRLKRPEKNLKEGSPLFGTLEEISRFVVPLNLLDPDSADFKPKNCKTYHDITRFVHEKAVHEMFNFGKDHNFSERSSKQLYYNVPMNWWILNLDDGFKEEVEGKSVRLEHIASIPMLALWEGISAIPWEGPPPIDGKGFMSVMFQATTNTALTTGMRSQYAEKNYFMISKNFCSLTSRLGFHFSTVETLVSDRAQENYISFHFKGGAADYQRRLNRVLFVGEILEENGFGIDIKEDNLIARVENLEKDAMLKHLKILGYLTIHTRQLDMIMAKESSVNYYRSKIKKEIQGIIEAHEKQLESLGQ
jgi:pyruvate,water dikinase